MKTGKFTSIEVSIFLKYEIFEMNNKRIIRLRFQLYPKMSHDN